MERNITKNKWVVIAELLAKNNNGLLPTFSWLKKNGYVNLYSCKLRHKKEFSHIPVETKLFTSSGEWVVIAERLANDNGGKLPTYTWLHTNGYSALNKIMSSNKSLFIHLEKENNIGMPSDERVSQAEKLADGNNGILPSYSWLFDNGYDALNKCISAYKTKFEHIPKETMVENKLKVWINTAERLTMENNNVLYNCAWLLDNGYGGLYKAMLCHPKFFSHLEQEDFKGRTPEEWRDVANTLIDADGFLPSTTWLVEHGFTGLPPAMRKYPGEFSGLKQNRNPRGFNADKPGVLYLINFSNRFCKIGITNKLSKRLLNLNNQLICEDLYTISSGVYFEFEDGMDACILENIIKTKFKDKSYRKLIDTLFDGKTELFLFDTMGEIFDFIAIRAHDVEYLKIPDSGCLLDTK